MQDYVVERLRELMMCWINQLKRKVLAENRAQFELSEYWKKRKSNNGRKSYPTPSTAENAARESETETTGTMQVTAELRLRQERRRREWEAGGNVV